MIDFLRTVSLMHIYCILNAHLFCQKNKRFSLVVWWYHRYGSKHLGYPGYVNFVYSDQDPIGEGVQDIAAKTPFTPNPH